MERKNGSAGFLTTFIVFGCGFLMGVFTQRIPPQPITQTAAPVAEQVKPDPKPEPPRPDWTKQKTRLELVEEECRNRPSGYNTFTDEEWLWIDNERGPRPKTGRYSLEWELEQKAAKTQREIAEQEERNRRIAEWWKKKGGK